MRPLRVAFLGAGHMAGLHAARVAATPGVTVSGVVDPDARRADDLARRLREIGGVPVATFRDLDGLDGLDAVFVCTPPDTHDDLVGELVGRGVAVFVEKPVSLDVASARRRERLVEGSGALVATGYQTRYSPVVEHVRGLIGDRRVAMATLNRFTRVPDQPWYRDVHRSGGQAVDMLTHQIDLLRALLGEVESVYSAGRHRWATTEPEIYDTQCSVLEFASGAVASSAANLVSGHGNPVEQRGIHVFAAGRTISILNHEGESRVVRVVDDDGRREVTFPEDSHDRQVAGFLHAVRTGDRSAIRSDYANGVRNLEVAAAMNLSAARRTPVPVPSAVS